MRICEHGRSTPSPARHPGEERRGAARPAVDDPCDLAKVDRAHACCARGRVARSWRSLAGAAPVGGQSVRSEVVRIGGLREQPDGAYLVIAAPPVSQSGTPLGGRRLRGDRRRRGGGERSPSARSGRPDGGDRACRRGSAPRTSRWSKNAATETLLALPDVARTIVISSGTEPKVLAPAGTDRRAASEAIAAVTRAPGATAASALDLAADELGDAPPEGDPPVRSGGVRDAGRDPDDRVPVGRRTGRAVHAGPDRGPCLLRRRGGGDRWPDGRRRAGRTRRGPRGARAVHRHRALVAVPGRLHPRRAAVASRRGSAWPRGPSRGARRSCRPTSCRAAGSTPQDRASPRPGPPGGTQDDGRDVPWAIVGIAGAAVVLLAGLTMLVLRRRRARPGPSFGVPTAQAVISAGARR